METPPGVINTGSEIGTCPRVPIATGGFVGTSLLGMVRVLFRWRKIHRTKREEVRLLPIQCSNKK